MSTYLLIHGAWHGAWCWTKIVPQLEAAGHTVITIDLPGHGASSTPIQAFTIAQYAEAVAEALDSASEPVYLVGHSMGGAVVSQAAEYRPEKIKALVYVTAFLLQNGQSINSSAEGNPEQAAALLDIDMATGLCTFKPELAPAVFYNDCSAEDATWATSQLGPESLVALGSAVSISEGNFGRIPRYYVECVQDQTIPIATQRSFVAALPCAQVFSIDAGHSPFLSQPEQLADSLLSI